MVGSKESWALRGEQRTVERDTSTQHFRGLPPEPCDPIRRTERLGMIPTSNSRNGVDLVQSSVADLLEAGRIAP
jgi:hypothetical protein